jgi:hypothetical protein
VPGISIDLLELEHAAQVYSNPSAFRAGVKEKILGRLVGLRGGFSIVQLFEKPAVGVRIASQNCKFGGRGGVILRGWRDIRKAEAWGRMVIVVITDSYPEVRERHRCGSQQR